MYRIKVSRFLIACVVLFAAACVIRREIVRTAPAEKPESGMFEWNDERIKDPQSAIDLAKKLGITRWYQEISDELDSISDRELNSFVEQMHENRISVYLLIGSVDWGFEEDGLSLKEHLMELLEEQKEAKEQERIDGVMLDIESYITEEWKEDPKSGMDRYVSCMKAAYACAKTYDVRVAVCIARNYDAMGLSLELEDLIAHACDEVAVMDYDCGNEIEEIRTEEMLARKYGKELHCILEFQEVEKHGLTEDETYRNKGIDAAQEVWERMQEEYPDTKLIQDYHCAYALQEMLQEQQ